MLTCAVPLDRGALPPGALAPITAAPLPARLQRSRKRGATTPEGARYVGRPTIHGNPFDWRRFGHARAVKMFNRWLDRDFSDVQYARYGFGPGEIVALRRKRAAILASLPDLRGQDLQCRCPLTSRWCHADTLLRLANG